MKIFGMSPTTFGLVATGATLVIGHALHQRAKERRAKQLFYEPTTQVTEKSQVKKLTNKAKVSWAKTPQSIGKYRLFFNDNDEIVDEEVANADPQSHYMIEVPIESLDGVNEGKRDDLDVLTARKKAEKDLSKVGNAENFIHKLEKNKYVHKKKQIE